MCRHCVHVLLQPPRSAAFVKTGCSPPRPAGPALPPRERLWDVGAPLCLRWRSSLPVPPCAAFPACVGLESSLPACSEQHQSESVPPASDSRAWPVCDLQNWGFQTGNTRDIGNLGSLLKPIPNGGDVRCYRDGSSYPRGAATQIAGCACMCVCVHAQAPSHPHHQGFLALLWLIHNLHKRRPVKLN